MFSRLVPAVILFVSVFLGAGIAASPALAIDEQEATRVGGDLARYGEKLAVLRNANSKVFGAARNTVDELGHAWRRIASAPSTRGFHAELAFSAASLTLLALIAFAVRRATRTLSTHFYADASPARGAGAVLGLDALNRLAVAAGAYLLIEFWCDIDTTDDLVAVALLWAFVRWWIAMLMVQALLRPNRSRFRLVPMADSTARALTGIAAFTLAIGIFSISIMPVLLRGGLPIPNGQFVLLVQGLIMLLAGALALIIYRRREYRRPDAPAARTRLWFRGSVLALVTVWIGWSVGTLLLSFSVYHALEWSLRIAAFAYIIDGILCMSATSHQVASSAGQVNIAFGHLWIPLLHRSIRVAAILAIAILLAETWLVKELVLIPYAEWEPIRRSLVTASVTLLIGYVIWRYLSQWTEYRLKAAVPVLGDGDDEARAPASRLTTILPVLRILLGITIVVLATLVALSQLGVNIGPLLAGAGVIGLAISFGSQALVRDIVSGIFFMADDAFRVGEYIDTGRLKGTVEKITLRSMQLRHHNGQIHTIPFGQLTSVSNFSRDWQTVKFNLRLNRECDVEKVRKTVKQIGLEMMQSPELAKEILQPLKLQGVAEIDDSAIVVRLRFTARPGKPSFVQREALKRIHKVFAEKDIAFSSNAVTVQTTSQGPLTLEAAGSAAAFNSAPRRATDAV
jgi:small-conductance mechanosensitive channel